MVVVHHSEENLQIHLFTNLKYRCNSVSVLWLFPPHYSLSFIYSSFICVSLSITFLLDCSFQLQQFPTVREGSSSSTLCVGSKISVLALPRVHPVLFIVKIPLCLVLKCEYIDTFFSAAPCGFMTTSFKDECCRNLSDSD